MSDKPNYERPPLRTVDDRIARLRTRLNDARDMKALQGVLKGILDLLNDEL